MTLIRQVKFPLFLLGLLLVSSCTTQYEIVPVRLPTVSSPVLTPIKSSELQCLSDQTYIKVVNREGKLRQWGQEQHNIIHVNNQQAEKRKQK